MPRPPVKSTMALTKAKLTAEAKFDKSNIGREVWLREQVEKLIDKIDPLELIAVISATFIVYDLIKMTPELLAQWRTKVIISASPILAIVIDRLFGGIELSEEQKAEYQRIRETPDFTLFLESFAIAYCVVKHSGQIVNGVGNITSFVASFMGFKVV